MRRQPGILIIDEDPLRRIGAEIKARLEEDGRGGVILFEGSLPDAEYLAQTVPDVIIPVLRASRARIDRVWRLLSRGNPQTPVTFDQSETQTLGLENLVGEDAKFVAVKRMLPRLARSEAPVLLAGETGTGKELCARALHCLSARASKAFLAINCGAIPVELFESELFGHQRGAFTGAWVAQPGLVAEAEGGTLFLDEIEALSLGAQVKLLRFLEHKTYYVLGSPRPRHADVRIVASTNIELSKQVDEGAFRKDLYYRLAVTSITLPPLRERRADIPLLVAHFLARHQLEGSGQKRQLSPAAMEALAAYGWPGNVRELDNVIQQIMVSTEATTIDVGALPIPLPPSLTAFNREPFKQAKARAIEQFEMAYLTGLLRRHGGNVSQAAREAQKERRAIGRLIKKYDLPKR